MSDLRPNSEIANGVHWVGGHYVNSYIVENNNELILIDTGMDKRAKNIIFYIHENLQDKKIAKILLTHHHLDHVGGAGHITDLLHPRVFISQDDYRYASGKVKRPLPNPFAMKVLFTMINPFVKRPSLNAVEFLEDGMVFDGVTVYHLPGHTMGSMGFEKAGAFYAGDVAMVNHKGEPDLGKVLVFAENIAATYNSFKKLANLEFNMLLAGHGPPILENASDRMKDIVEKLEL